MDLETCTSMSASGANGEMLRCGFAPGHTGDHAWASLPTFFGGVAQPTAAQAAGGERALTRALTELREARERIATLEADLDHARHTANLRYAWGVAQSSNTAPQTRALAELFAERSQRALDGRVASSDGWEVGMSVESTNDNCA